MLSRYHQLNQLNWNTFLAYAFQPLENLSFLFFSFFSFFQAVHLGRFLVFWFFFAYHSFCTKLIFGEQQHNDGFLFPCHLCGFSKGCVVELEMPDYDWQNGGNVQQCCEMWSLGFLTVSPQCVLGSVGLWFQSWQPMQPMWVPIAALRFVS